MLKNLDLLIFGIYILGVIGFGVSFSFRKRTAKDFTTGGGRLPSWALGMSIFATFVSSISFLALPGNAFGGNWNSFVFSLSIPIAAWIAVKFFVPLYRRLNSESAYFYLEERFGTWARIYASVFYLLTQLARMGAILYLLALPMQILFGWSIPVIIICTGLSVIIYSMFGGIEAVVWTDAIQGIVLIAGAIACLGVIFWTIPGGASEVFSTAFEADKFSLGSFDFDFSSSTFWMILVYGLFINLQNFGVDQSYVQRYISSKTERDAVKSTWLGSMLYVPVSFLFFLIGTALWAFYQQFSPNYCLLEIAAKADQSISLFHREPITCRIDRIADCRDFCSRDEYGFDEYQQFGDGVSHRSFQKVHSSRSLRNSFLTGFEGLLFSDGRIEHFGRYCFQRRGICAGNLVGFSLDL